MIRDGQRTAIADLRAVAHELGGEVSGWQVLCPGPGHSARDRSLSVKLDPSAPNGLFVHSFAGDDWRVCRDYVRARLGLAAWQPGDEQDRVVPTSSIPSFDRAAVDRASDRQPRTEDDLIRIERAVRIWNEAQNPCGTVAEQYLKSRALELPPDVCASVLRFHPRCPWRNENSGSTERIPSLLAAFRSIDDDLLTAVHRIRLDQRQNWPKAGRRMLGLVGRAAVKLDAIEGDTLVIGEGVETALAARQLGHGPAWALGSVGSISFFPVLDGVKRLIILGEAGKPSADAIKLCGQRWSSARRQVQIIYSEVGSDLNDALMVSSQ
jgi:hypothetical protein